MSREEIIRMAREAGFATSWTEAAGEALERFAALVAAAEREACAKLVESRKTEANELMDAMRDMEAAAIRARIRYRLSDIEAYENKCLVETKAK
jgi:hypothetical protein